MPLLRDKKSGSQIELQDNMIVMSQGPNDERIFDLYGKFDRRSLDTLTSLLQKTDSQLEIEAGWDKVRVQLRANRYTPLPDGQYIVQLRLTESR